MVYIDGGGAVECCLLQRPAHISLEKINILKSFSLSFF